MSSILEKFKLSRDKDAAAKTRLMTRNGETILKELIAASNGKYHPYRTFSAKVLDTATNNYDEHNFICEGMSSKLYKGFWQKRPICVMKFDKNLTFAHNSSINNIIYVSQMRHKHILKLIGCCLETEIPILVFESVEYGTLYERIQGARQPLFEPLLLTHRLKIAMDIAHAVAYLHTGFPRPVVFRDIKSSNILFNEKYAAKLFDFSLSESTPEGQTHIESPSLAGTIGFIVPEYLRTMKFNEKCDVYSFGICLLELLTGQKSYDYGRGVENGGVYLIIYVKRHLDNQ